jgi:hypothetical protein
MRKELRDKLFTKFPFYGYDEWKGNKNALLYTLMPFGFECGDGWFDIIWQLSECIANELDNVRRNAKWRKLDSKGRKPIDPDAYRVIQVKEKFGTLRFYDMGFNSHISGMISMAEAMSEITCERCGARGKLREDRGWLLTLCDKCDRKDKRWRFWLGCKYRVLSIPRRIRKCVRGFLS